MFKKLFFVLRIAIAWGIAVFLVVAMYSSIVRFKAQRWIRPKTP